MKIKYVVFRQKAQYGWISHKELFAHADVLLDRDIPNKILSFINNIHSAARVNKNFELPFQSFWFKYYLDESKLNRDDEIIFMFEDGSRPCFIWSYLKYLKRRYPKSHLCFASFNCSFRYPPKRLKKIEKYYDFITSFDRKDCKERGWGWYSGIYSKMDDMEPNGEYESDVYFAGADKGRLPLVLDIYKGLTAAGLKCDFYVTSVKQENIIPDCGIHFNEWVNYETVVEKCCKTRCLLDVIQPGQDGETYRQGEAVAYGIKLLTNYQNIVSERYYNPQQMQVFKTADDIDINFIKEPYSFRDFPYNGCLAPYKRLLWLSEQFKNK